MIGARRVIFWPLESQVLWLLWPLSMETMPWSWGLIVRKRMQLDRVQHPGLKLLLCMPSFCDVWVKGVTGVWNGQSCG